ncbi:SCY1-like protein 2 isoform X4 [Planococcus citri]|uniref:SCY1-like protein 2 isoform X4 n=1 Tax=Planococcus citri TaxID=170843 RepID=UPI0031F949EE
MLASSMFAKLKAAGASISSPSGPNILTTNPISQFFDIGPQICTAGPELVWKVFQATRKSDGKDVSIFVFEKRLSDRLHRPRRKDSITEIMKKSVKHLEVYRQPKLILTVLHSLEECSDTIAFASEPILASLANILSFQVYTNAVNSARTENTQPNIPRPPNAKEYNFIDFEIKYGLRQIAEALDFLSTQVYHHNICPNSILVTKLGNWKLAGMEFLIPTDKNDHVACGAWTSRMSKLAQPDLDYMAPEVQMNGYCGTYSDMFSLGLLIFTIFNKGRPILQANHSNSSYQKQLDMLDENVQKNLHRIPMQLQEMVVKMLCRDTAARPSVKTLLNTPYFCDRYVETLQNLDVINLKDPVSKSQFYRSTLKEALPYLPRKIWYQRVWPFLQTEMQTPESLASALQPVMYLIEESTLEEYEKIILPEFRKLLQAHRSIQATVTILENLHIILEKTPRDDIRREVLPVLYKAFESNSIQIQSAALTAVTNVSNHLEEAAIRRMVLPKMKNVYDCNSNDVRVLGNILNCIEKVLDRLDKQQILDEVLPLIWDFKIYDSDMIIKVIRIYRILLSDKKYGLTVNIIATSVMPSLVPHTVCPALNLETFTLLLEVLQEMLDIIDRNQRNKLKLDSITLPSPERHRPLRHLYSSDNMHVPPFNIPNLRVEQRKTSSAEDMARKNSTGSGICSWWFGGSPVSSDSNFLRVINAFPNRRLSDNTLMAPKIRIAPSCASSPGGTPGGSTGGLPIRRHSSIGPQERRGSTINLSPPTLARSMIGGSMPNTSSSSPYLWSSGLNRSRRPSTCLTGSQTGSGNLLHQLSSGMQNFFGGNK